MSGMRYSGLWRLAIALLVTSVCIEPAISESSQPIALSKSVKSEFEKLFFETKREKIKYVSWPRLAELDTLLVQVDEFGYLADEPITDNFTDADLVMFFLKGWHELDDIPIEFSGFQPIFDLVDREAVEMSISFDLDVKSGNTTPKRIYLLNVEYFFETAMTDSCKASYVYGSAFSLEAFQLWLESGCVQ